MKRWNEGGGREGGGGKERVGVQKVDKRSDSSGSTWQREITCNMDSVLHCRSYSSPLIFAGSKIKSSSCVGSNVICTGIT